MSSITIYDVAQKSGVSISTVSRVMNNNPSVREETRQKVLEIIAEMNFKPNPIARGLVVKQTNIIEVFFSWVGYRVNLLTAWNSGILDGINQVAQENQYGLLINTIAGLFDRKEVYKRVFQNAVDGILIVSPYLEEKEVIQMLENRLPFVLIGYRTNDPRMDFVDSDNVLAASQVVDYLVGLGHRKIALIAGETKISRNAADRLTGFQEGLKKHGLTLPEEYIAYGDFLRESGEEAMKTLLKLVKRPTAVFASNDSMAIGAIKVIEEAGLKVGKDIALVGFDDIPEASLPSYSLTTMRQDFHAISAKAMQFLLGKIHDPEHWKAQQVLVPTRLIVRQSSGTKK